MGTPLSRTIMSHIGKICGATTIERLTNQVKYILSKMEALTDFI